MGKLNKILISIIVLLIIILAISVSENTKRPLKKDHENADTMTIKELEDATRDVISYYNDIEYSSDYNVELSNTLFGNEKLKSVEERE